MNSAEPLLNSTTSPREEGVWGASVSVHWKNGVFFWILALSFVAAYGYIADKIDRRGRRQYPILGDCSWWQRRAWFWCQWFQNPMTLFWQGYEKYSKKNAIWATWLLDDIFYVFPPKMADELKSFPPDKLNFTEIVNDQFMWHLYMEKTLTNREYVFAVNKHLGSNLPDLTPLISDAVEKAMLQRFASPPNSQGWRVTMLWDGMLDICNQVVGHIMVGDLGTSQKYLQHATGFIDTITGWSGSMFILPSWLRVVYFRLSRGGRDIRRHLRETKSLIIPELQRIQSKEKASKVFSMMQVFLKSSSHHQNKNEYDEAVHQALILTFAAAAMSNMILCQTIQNYLAFPEYQEELKNEVETALAEHGGWTKHAFLHMPRLESFVRETLRCGPPIIYTIQRKVMQRVQLSEGTVLNPGEKIMIPTYGILQDPEIYPDPTTFKPYRFYNAEQNVATVLPVTQTAEFPVFGFGNQTCPGRFFGSLLIKVAVARLLMDYDMKFVPKRLGKPVDWPIGATLMPNMDTFVAFRRKTQI